MAGGFEVVGGGLGADPVDEFGDAVVEWDAGGEAVGLEAADVGDAVADVARAEFFGDFGLDGAIEVFGEGFGDVQDTDGVASADVEDASVHFVTAGREEVGLDDVGDVSEVAGLVAVFEKDGWVAVEQAPGEDGGDAGVGVGKSLAGTVDVEVAQGDDGDVVGAAHGEAHFFLVFFADGVDGGGVERFVFGGRKGGEGPAACLYPLYGVV